MSTANHGGQQLDVETADSFLSAACRRNNVCTWLHAICGGWMMGFASLYPSYALDASGQVTREYVWLDAQPIAVLTPTAPGAATVRIDYLVPDHLGTPRLIVDSSAPNQDPAGSGTPYVFNLRFPGQYFDAETGLSYNYMRTYEPGTGRYIESDPVGLDGGSFSTFTYVNNNPINYTDPIGENPVIPAAEACLSNPLCATAASATTGFALTCLINPSLCKTAAKLACDDLSDAWDEFTKPMLSQDQKLSPGEIKKLKEKGYDPEALKGGKRTGQRDLFKDKKGNITVKPKDGSGPGDDTGININNL